MKRGSRELDRGASAVEFAILLPVLILILGGILEFGRMMYTQNIAVGAAREGARALAVGYTKGESDARVDGALFGYAGTGRQITTTAITAAGPTVKTSAADFACPTGGASLAATDRAKVLVKITGYNWIFPMPMAVPNLGGTAEMRCGG